MFVQSHLAFVYTKYIHTVYARMLDKVLRKFPVREVWVRAFANSISRNIGDNIGDCLSINFGEKSIIIKNKQNAVAIFFLMKYNMSHCCHCSLSTNTKQNAVLS